jgi:uncharacterized phage-like protein YoqJ
MKTCSFTGHREYPEGKVEYVRAAIRHEVKQAIEDGFTRFISGFAKGSDLTFAGIVLEFQDENSAITLEAALPYEGRLAARDGWFQSLIKRCAEVHVVSERYSSQCYLFRNHFLVDNCERLSAVFDGRNRSGTAQTIRIAEKVGRDIRIIKL